MKMDKVANSGNDEFYTPEYAIAPLSKYVAPDLRIWCPFDTDESLIVKHFRSKGNFVTSTHKESGGDFFSLDIACDIIISNPPYSKKAEVFARLFTIGKPFAMLVGVVGLFESERRFSLFAENSFEIMWLSKRVAYFKSYADEKPSLNPPFSSVWITSSVLPQNNVFERIVKRRRPTCFLHRNRGITPREGRNAARTNRCDDLKT